MVLSELGAKISSSLAKLSSKPSAGEEEVKTALNDVARALLAADVNVRLISKLKKQVMEKVEDKLDADVDLAPVVDAAVFNGLVDMLDSGTKPFRPKKRQSNVIMFVGLQGAGKTTTVAKVASHYKRSGFRVACVCADTFRAGAYHQLVQNCQRVRVPYYGDPLETDPVKVAQEGVALFKREGFEVILVDTSGRHKQESALFEEMRDVSSAVDPNEVIFVMDGSIGQAAHGQAEAFAEAVDVGAVVVTKLDGGSQGGGALSAVAATGAPVTFYGTGERFEDLERFDARSFVSVLLGRGDLKGLARKLATAVSEEEQEALMKKLAKGKMTLRDFGRQFEMVSKMGSLSSIIGMIPGMGPLMQQMGGGDADMGGKLKRFLIILDSMSEEELDGDVKVDAKRAHRIAKGAGAHLQEVHMLLMLHNMFDGMMGKMAKAGLLKTSKGAEAKMMQEMKRNPAAMRKKLASSVDPKLLAQMGGVDNFMRMMEQMGGGGPGGGAARGGGGGMPDMSALAGMMGGGGRGGMPDLSALAGMMGGGGRGGMPDMSALAGMMGGAGGGGMPDINAMMAAMGRGRGRGRPRIIRGRK